MDRAVPCPTQCPQAPSGGSRETGQTRCCVVAEATAGRDCVGRVGGGRVLGIPRAESPQGLQVWRWDSGLQFREGAIQASWALGGAQSQDCGQGHQAERAEWSPSLSVVLPGEGDCSQGVRSCVGPPEVRTHAGATLGQCGGQWPWAVNFLGEHQGGDGTWHEAGGKRW